MSFNKQEYINSNERWGVCNRCDTDFQPRLHACPDCDEVDFEWTDVIYPDIDLEDYLDLKPEEEHEDHVFVDMFSYPIIGGMEDFLDFTSIQIERVIKENLGQELYFHRVQNEEEEVYGYVVTRVFGVDEYRIHQYFEEQLKKESSVGKYEADLEFRLDVQEATKYRIPLEVDEL